MLFRSIEKLLCKMAADNLMEGQVSLRLKLVQIAATGALTFAADDEDALSAIAGTATCLALWLRFIAKIDDNILLTNSSVASLPTFKRNLLRWVRCVGVNFEPYFHRHPKKQAALREFCALHWSGGQRHLTEHVDWERCPAPSDQCYSLKFPGSGGGDGRLTETKISVDIILGCFLVNNKPVGRLPHYITQSADFQQLFQGHIFVVHSAAGSDAYATKDRYHNCTYEFEAVG